MTTFIVSSEKERRREHNSFGNFNGKTDGDKFEIKLRKRNWTRGNLLTLFTFSGHRFRTHCFSICSALKNLIKSNGVLNYKLIIHSNDRISIAQNSTFIWKKKQLKSSPLKYVLYVGNFSWSIISHLFLTANYDSNLNWNGNWHNHCLLLKKKPFEKSQHTAFHSKLYWPTESSWPCLFWFFWNAEARKITTTKRSHCLLSLSFSIHGTNKNKFHI